MSKLSEASGRSVEARPFARMSEVNPNAAGVDIGAHEIMVCRPLAVPRLTWKRLERGWKYMG